MPYGPCPISQPPPRLDPSKHFVVSMRDYLLLPGANPSAVDLDVAALCRPIIFASGGSTSA